jgi:hypothetical protein
MPARLSIITPSSALTSLPHGRWQDHREACSEHLQLCLLQRDSGCRSE